MNINKWLKDNPVPCKYGAPFGDRGEEGIKDYPYKFHLQRIRMRCLVYDLSGTYWGHGVPLYGYMGEDDQLLVRGFVRAENRDDAKKEIIEKYPNAMFYR